MRRISVAVCFAFIPIIAEAAGLGKLTVISGLGQPLNAEIELLSTTPEELDSLSARIAPAEAFEQHGIEKASALSGVFVQVGKRADGAPILRLTSSQPINEPFLDMLIQVEWATGRLLREYTVLLDPPGYGSQSLASVTDLPSVDAVPGGPAEKPAVRTKRRGTAAAMAPMTPDETADTYLTRKGDTLHRIAVQNQMEGVSLEQLLVGLYRANREAFLDDNMNRLKVGQILRIPAQEALQAIDQQEAVREVRLHAADWNAYRSKLAGMVAAAAPVPEEATGQVSGGKVATAEDKSLPPSSAGPRDVVRLSKSETGALKPNEGEIASKLTALQEEATAREKALREAESRIASLEKQLQDMQKLLEIKNKSLAEAQQAAQTAGAPPASAPVAQPAQPPTPPPAEAAKPTEAPMPAAEKPMPEQAAPKPQPPQKPAKVMPPPAPEPNWLDMLWGNPLLLGAGLGLLALLGGGWLFLRNKRKQGLDTFEQGILTSGGMRPNTVFGNTAGGTIDTGNTSFLTDFGQGATTMIDTNEVDPIAEAEVYMAYGRDAQAEEILKDAIAKEPKRYELHLKLLEIYLARKDTSAFETVAGELYASLGPHDPTWAKVAELGRKLEPNNPLYAEAGAAAVSKPEEELDFTATMIQPPARDSEAPAIDLVTEPATPEVALDFTLDEAVAQPANAEVAPEQAGESGGLDFDLTGLEMPQQQEQPAPIAEQGLPDLDLVLPELEQPAAAAASERQAESTLESAAAEVDFALDLPELEQTAAEPAPERQEAVTLESPATEVDLALELPEPAAAENVQLDIADLGLETLPEIPATEARSDVEAAVEVPSPSSLEQTLVESAPAVMTQQAEAAHSLEASDSMREPEAALTAAPSLEQEGVEPLELELPALELPAEESVAGLETVSLDLPEEKPLDLSIESVTMQAPETAPVTEEPAEGGAAGLDLDFDIDLGAPAPTEAPAPTAPPLADLDLSGISLNLEESGPAGGAGMAEEITLGGETEPPEVDTKLDLVTAYIDMGDHEGARELLQEVLQEGGPTQREKAQKLLDSLG
ncbi:MAG: hypothetical protein N2Z69_04935 [Methylophilaceae bacterium]|nr:hypothetical protein [Methylophilaceae bacterium]